MLWPLVLLTVIGGFVAAIFRGRTPIIRMLGVVALLSGIAYLFTPLTAAGPTGEPSAFAVNLRYASPALALGALLLAVDPWVSRERIQPYALGGLGSVVVGLVSGADDVWTGDYLVGAILLAIFLIAVPVFLTLASRWGFDRPTIAIAAALAIGIVVGIGWSRNEEYIGDRYQAATALADFPEGIRSALELFNQEDPRDARVAVVGGRPGFKQYVFYGKDLSNHVQYVAHEGPARGVHADRDRSHRPHGNVAACEEWLTALNEGDYDYVIIGPDQRTQGLSPVEAAWTGADPAATELLEDDLTFVFAIDGELDPAGCTAVAEPPKPPKA